MTKRAERLLKVLSVLAILMIGIIAWQIRAEKREVETFRNQLTWNLDTWPVSTAMQGDVERDGKPTYWVRVAMDSTTPLWAKNWIIAYQEAGDKTALPRLVIWTTFERSKTEFTKHVEGGVEVQSYTIVRETDRMYVRTDGASRYVLVETKVFDRATSPEGKFPLFTKDSPFGKWYYWFFQQVGKPESEVHIPTGQFLK